MKYHGGLIEMGGKNTIVVLLVAWIKVSERVHRVCTGVYIDYKC